MRGFEWLSFSINLLVGVYFIYLYPKTLARSFRERPIPPGFQLLRTLLRGLGWAIIIGTLGYAAYPFILANN